MENHIVKEFQNLRVFSKRQYLGMDELVQDLTNALEETAYTPKHGSKDNMLSAKRQCKKRKGKKRRTYVIDGGNISEASESSLEEAIKDYIENVAQQSDSDDVNVTERVARLTMPLSSNFVPTVESDSVTETFSPTRPQRRRKKFQLKPMIVDSVSPPSYPQPISSSHRSLTKYPPVPQLMADDVASCSHPSVYPGKRKRSSKSRSEISSREGSHTTTGEGNHSHGDINTDADGMELSSQ